MGQSQERQEPPQHRVECPMPGQGAQHDDETKVLNQNYKLNVANQIGEGAYGAVFVGECRRTHKKVAVKKIKLENEKDGFPMTSVREIKILNSLSHENIVNLRSVVRSEIHKSNKYKGSVYMVFDYAEHDLSGLLTTHRAKFTEAQIKCIMKQLLKGLAHVHLNGVLHRDLKAANILVDKDGMVKLADFGLARTYALQQDDQTGHLSPRVITLWYRPPELLLESTKYGPEVDIWSLGCIFAELLVGRVLFEGRDEPDQLHHIFSILGSPNRSNWPGVEELRNWHMVKNKHAGGGQGLRNWLYEQASKQGIPPPHPAAIDLIEKMLRLDPTKRPSAVEAFKHPWFWSHEPPPCEPKDLPVGGSSHEYTVKKRRQELEQQRRRQGAEQSGHQDKRARPNDPPQPGLQAAGYNNAYVPRPQAYNNWPTGAPGVMGPMGPPSNRPAYQNSGYGPTGHVGHPTAHMPPPAHPLPGRGAPLPQLGAPPPGNSQQQPYRRSQSRWDAHR